MYLPVIPIVAFAPAIFAQSFIQEKLANGEPAGTLFGEVGQNRTFDYVVVGGGLAGSVVASRLAEDPDVSVAVIEPGTFYETTNGNNSQVPLYSLKYINSEPSDYQPLVDWGLTTVPLEGAGNRRIHYAQGKMLGGGSGRNQMLYHRGTVGAFKAWADKVGDNSYLWDNYFPFFQRSTQFTPPTVGNVPLRAGNATTSYLSSAYSPSGGPLHVSFPNWANPASSYFGAAFSKGIGLQAAKDFSSGVLNGSAYFPFTIDPQTGLRSSSETSFLSTALRNASASRRSNIQVYTLSQASRVLFNDNKTATGVMVEAMGAKFVLSASKEVILSAGAWHSPQLLMLSGIGPRATLEQHNISTLVDLPGVGQNMWDTTNVGGVSYEVSVPTTSITNTPAGMAESVEMFNQNRTGFLSTSGGDFAAWQKFPSDVVANFSQATKDHIAQFPSDWPEIEYVVNSEAGSISSGSATANYVTIGVLLIATKSRGNMTISSSSIHDPPVINPNWFLDPVDQEMGVAAVRQARKVWGQVPIRIGKEHTPGSQYQTDEQIIAQLKKSITPIHHASSSCQMRKRSDPMAVVDSHGKVIGVDGLRVIDSSSLAFTPPGHTQGYTYAHAEKLVNDIKTGN